MFCFQTSTSITAYFVTDKILIFERFHGLLEENRLPALYLSSVQMCQRNNTPKKKNSTTQSIRRCHSECLLALFPLSFDRSVDFNLKMSETESPELKYCRTSTSKSIDVKLYNHFLGNVKVLIE